MYKSKHMTRCTCPLESIHHLNSRRYLFIHPVKLYRMHTAFITLYYRVQCRRNFEPDSLFSNRKVWRHNFPSLLCMTSKSFYLRTDFIAFLQLFFGTRRQHFEQIVDLIMSRGPSATAKAMVDLPNAFNFVPRNMRFLREQIKLEVSKEKLITSTRRIDEFSSRLM